MARSDIMRGSLALILVFAFCAVQWALFSIKVPPENKETLTYAMGQLSGMVTTALAFYFATTQGSEQKTHMLADHREQKVAEGPAAVDATLNKEPEQ